MPIEKVAVIGSGVMGSGIAAQIANAGIPVCLLDIVAEGKSDRSSIARSAIAKALKTDPAPFMSKKAAKLVTPGNLEDDLEQLADCDLIIEVIIEKLDIKQSLYARIEPHLKADAIIASNTSTLPLAQLMANTSANIRERFAITHFFNPPRYMRLVELIAGPETKPEVMERLSAFMDMQLGKTPVECKDTPGFIANRIGTFWMQEALNRAIDINLPVEEADAVMGAPMGIPKTGVFGLADLVGIDLLPYVSASLCQNLDADDLFVTRHIPHARVASMIEDGYTGRKGKGGFYRLNREGGGKVKEAINLESGTWRVSKKPRFDFVKAAKKGGPRAVFEGEHRAANYAWDVMRETLLYALTHAFSISDSLDDIDASMRLGYNWKKGPFELLDQIGPSWFRERIIEEGLEVPTLLKTVGDGTFYAFDDGKLQVMGADGAHSAIERPEGVLLLSDIKRNAEPIIRNSSASLWDIGDGVVCFEFTGKMNALDAEVIDLMKKTIKRVEKDYKALVIYNEGRNFSVGANLGLALFAANTGVWPMIDSLIEGGQKVNIALRSASFPVVAAPSGMALGGGCEICLYSHAIQAHAETYMGLVEVGVGVIPGWGGTAAMIYRHKKQKGGVQGPMPALAQAFQTIGTAKVAKSAHEAKEMLFLRKQDGITMNRDRLLFDAKQRALAMVGTELPNSPEESIALPGAGARAAFELAVRDLHSAGQATDHDVTVSRELGYVLSGGDTDIVDLVEEKTLLELEREAFMSLLRTEPTLNRIEHMLATGKPLRN